MRYWRNVKLILIGFLFLWSSISFAADFAQEKIYPEPSQNVNQQLDLLKNRVDQSRAELTALQQQQNTPLSVDNVSKQLLKKSELEIAVAKSNVDSVTIELNDSQQTIVRLEKEIQEIDNQLNVYNIFGLKIAGNGAPNFTTLKNELNDQKNLLQLEKKRCDYLLQLQDNLTNLLQLRTGKYNHIEGLLKSQTLIQLKKQHAKSEINFHEQQNYWLQQLNLLDAQLQKLPMHPSTDKNLQTKIEDEIFYAHENVNFIYFQMLISRYQDQIEQLKVSVARTSSITLLNKDNEQMQLVSKQLDRVKELFKSRIQLLNNRQQFLMENETEYKLGLENLVTQYTAGMNRVNNLQRELTHSRASLDQALQQELSARQGLPGFGANAWLDLGAELILVPTLTFQMIKSLGANLLLAVHHLSYSIWALALVLEMLWFGFFYLLNNFLIRIVSGVPDHEFGHINLKWLIIKLAHRNLIDIAIIGNLTWIFYFCGIPSQNFNFLLNLTLVWLFFKITLLTARLCLVETLHHRSGHDVRLYHSLKWTLIVGGIITALSVSIRQLPLIFEVKDLFDRLFLSFLLIASIFFLKSWQVLPGLILPHIDNRHIYIRRVVNILGLLIPIILLMNSAIGLCGYVNFVQTISWYQSIFLLGLVTYLFLRGILNDIMHLISQLLIRHVTHGWLWTEAFLKPFDKILRIALFLVSWMVLFRIFGWDKQSAIVISLNKLLHYHLIDLFNTSFTPFSIIELIVTISIVYWAARWMREFTYRFLLSRTQDLGIRNSIAILTQYLTILIGILVCLRVLGIDLHALTFVASAFALGVGLGLRDLVNNFACGFLLLIERPIRVGDTVTINGYEGDVIHIGGRAVTIRTCDHTEILVPNVEIFSKTFLNWTGGDHIVRTVVSIKINRHDKPQLVQGLIYEVLAQHKDILREPPAEVFLKELTDGLTEFEVRYFVNLRQVKSRLEVRSQVLMAIWDTFAKHGIKAPYPHHEIYVKADLPLLDRMEVS